MYHQRQKFDSPPNQSRPQFQSSPIHHTRPQFQSSPIMRPSTHFQNRGGPYSRSPGYSQSNMHLTRNKSPFHPAHRGLSPSFNNSTSSPEQWNRSNASFNSNSSSSSNYTDVSQLSPYNSPQHRNNRSSYYSQNRIPRFQGKQSFHSSESNDSNPGHSHDIRLYVQPSMLEDPWKDLMAEMEKQN